MQIGELLDLNKRLQVAVKNVFEQMYDGLTCPICASTFTEPIVLSRVDMSFVASVCCSDVKRKELQTQLSLTIQILYNTHTPHTRR